MAGNSACRQLGQDQSPLIPGTLKPWPFAGNDKHAVLEKSFFYSLPLNRWDKATLFIYSIITIFIWSKLSNHSENSVFWALFYGIGTVLFNYFFNYKSLRNLTVFVIWCFMGVLHLVLFALYSGDSSMSLPGGNALTPLRNTLILLGLYQILRYLSLKVKGVEFAAPSRGGKDMWDSRKLNWIDTVCLIIYLVTFILLTFKS